MSAPVVFPVFRDRSGNRLIFPGLHSQDGTLAPSRWGQCRHIEVALGVTEEKYSFAVVPEDGYLNFSRVEAEAGSRGFAHGSSTVWLIGGPRFEKVLSEVNQ